MTQPVVNILSEIFQAFVAPTKESRSGVYLLLEKGEVVYVGSTISIDVRIGAHLTGADKDAYPKTFDSVLWLNLPIEVILNYEGALIRALKPRLNFYAPTHWRYDNVILSGLGLPTHVDQKQNWIDWKNHTRSLRRPRSDVGQKRRPYRQPESP